MALRSEAAAAAAAAEFCCAYAPVGVKGAARTISCKPLAICCSMSWTRGVDHEEGTSLVSYGSLGRESQWLSGNFLDLRLRSATLFSTEASGALKRHFKSREPVQEEVRNEELPAITSSPHQMLHSAFEDAAIFDIEMLLRNHLTRVSGPRGSILDESWC